MEENSRINNNNSKRKSKQTSTMVSRDRKNSLLMNCDVKPETSRKKFYETINELKNRFSSTFPNRYIILSQECPYCHEAVHDVHIRLGWSNNDRSFDTKCPNCKEQFPAKFLVKESQEYRIWFHDLDTLQSLEFFRMRDDTGTFIKSINGKDTKNINNNDIKKERENAITNTIAAGDQIVAINGHDVTNKSMIEIQQMLKEPPTTLLGDLSSDIKATNPFNKNPFEALAVPVNNDIESSASDNDDEPKQPRKLQKQSTKSKLMSLMKLNKDKKEHDPICLSFRRVILCPYFSPLILYREIRKVIQNHALSLSDTNNQKSRPSIDETKESDNTSSYRRKTKKTKQKTDKENIKKLLQESGISAITSDDFRIKNSELFWNLAWHFSNLRLPLHFLANAFDDKSQINTASIDDLIQFVPLNEDKTKNFTTKDISL